MSEDEIPEVNSESSPNFQYKLVSDVFDDNDEEYQKYMKLVEFIFTEYNLSSCGLILRGSLDFKVKAHTLLNEMN